MSENTDTGREGEDERGRRLWLLGARVSCVVGMLFAAGSVLAALAGGNPEISGGAVAVGLGILGHFLGSRRLATLTAFVGAAAILFALAASGGLIPGVESFDREMTDQEPASEIREPD